MQRRIFPHSAGRPVPSESILLYGFGLALTLSLVFNGFLLYSQSHQRNIYEYDLDSSGHTADNVLWQRQLSECKRVNQQQDSLIRQLEQTPDTPPGGTVAIQRTTSK